MSKKLKRKRKENLGFYAAHFIIKEITIKLFCLNEGIIVLTKLISNFSNGAVGTVLVKG